MQGDSSGNPHPISAAIYAIAASKFWTTALLIGLAIAGLYLFLSWRDNVQSVQLALLKQENALRQGELKKMFEGFDARDKVLTESNVALQKAYLQLDQKVGALAAQSQRLKDDLARRQAVVATLPLSGVGLETARIIAVPADAIRELPEGLLFNPVASRANLAELMAGETAKQRLDLAVEQVATLRTQNGNLGQENANLGGMLENEKARGATVAESLTMNIEEARKETSAVKAKARKRSMVAGLVGFAVGVGVAVAF